MPPLMVYILTLFKFMPFSIWHPTYTYPTLKAVRHFAKQYGGIIYSRQDYKTGKTYELEHWRDGVIVWRNPNYDAIMKSTQDYLDEVGQFWELAPYWIDPNDVMP